MSKVLGRLFLLTLLLNFSCIGKKVITSPTAFQGECLQGLDFERSEDGFLADSLKVGERLKENFDEKIIDLAIAMNAVPEMESYLDEDLDRLDKLELKTRIFGKIMKMDIELHSLMSAIDCEEEKAEQIASFLEKELRKKERNLTVAAIITGAVVGVGTGLILAADNSRSDWPEYIGIAGGLTEVFLGISILRLDRRVSINHPKNILRDVYLSEMRPAYFPPATWYYFNSKNNSKEGVSLKDQLLERWETYNMNGDGMTALLSDGGEYSPELLKNRSEMLDQLESQIALISKDLLYFLNQIERFY
ncbi:hypothetical protein [Mongoliibacter sp.]|uniref:hypothetical protein n=1 Tax=Mongoliibacter sp. TaxID=2022438 RepID=UPI0025F4FED5|nr:hypothetical protein [Mongoliibacter sp.]